MTFIEGVGDEVTVFAVVLLVFILAATITFLLNNTPFSERRVSLTTPNTAVHQVNTSVNQANLSVNQQTEEPQTENERNDQSNRNVETVGSNSPSCSINKHDDVHSTADETKPVDSKNSEVHTENSVNTQIYPDIHVSECDSANNTEESDIETEERPSPDPDEIHVRLKYLDDTERSITSNPSVKIGDFKRIHFAEDISNNKLVRLIFSGQLLQDNATLQSYGVVNNCVVHVQILQAQTQQNATSASQNTDLDLSHLLWPLCSVILGICWILYFKYPEFFNLMSLGILFLFTGSFVYFYSQVQNQ